MSELVASAVTMAKYLHRNQRRKYTNEPYTNHLKRVAEWVSAYPYGGEVAFAVAWLHDSIEDTEAEYEDILYLFGEGVAKPVHFLTSTPRSSGLNRAQRKEKDRDRLFECGSAFAHLVKVCDIMDNITDITEHDPDFAEVYIEEKALMLDVLHLAPDSAMAEAQGILENCRKALRDR